MKSLRPVLAISLMMTLVACQQQDGPDKEVQNAEADSGNNASNAAPLPGPDYRAVDIMSLTSADSMTSACVAEEQAQREALNVLETRAADFSDAEFLEFLNSQSVSAGNMASRAGSLAAVHPDETVRDAGDTCGQTLSSVGADYALSRPIFDRLNAVDLSSADTEMQRHVEKMLLSFRLAGVDKDEATREKVKALIDEIVAIGQEFDRNINDAVAYLELDSVDQLAGLPQDYIDAHPPGEDGLIRISTQYPDLYPLMTYAEDEDVRRRMLVLFTNRAYPENEAVLQQLLQKRFELATLLGFRNYAELITADKMVGSPERVEQFLAELKGYTVEAQDRDYEMLLARLQQDRPEAERVDPWQRQFLSEKVRQEQFSVDSKVVREYFSYNSTRDGILTLIQDLFGVEIRPWQTAAWHEDVEAFEMYENGELLGRFFLDMHPREGKFGHAAVFPMQNGIQGVQVPMASLFCNFPRGDELMPHSQVQTFLHEFGHLIHYLFAGRHQWDNISGISTEWDFVEAPSQMLQEWVWDYDTVSGFAKNAEGEVLPQDLLDRMIAARDFGLGMGTRRQLSFAALSMGLYNRDPEGLDIKAFADEVTRTYTRMEPMDDSFMFASFGHLNGYSAIYYTYQWSLAIATDMFTRFEQDGLRNVETAGEYREKVLGAGGSRPAADMVTDFLGREISFKPYADRLSGAAVK